MRKLTDSERSERRQAMLYRLIGIPLFEFKTPNNKFIVQPVLIDMIPSDEYTGRNSWIDRQIRFYEKLDRMFLKWEIKRNLRENQHNFEEVLASSEVTDDQRVKAHQNNVAMRRRNGKKANKSMGILWEDECPPNTLFFAETCSHPRPQFWWLPRLKIQDRALIDHHIAQEVERGDWN